MCACTNKDGHTVALLLTETKIRLLLFPFTKGNVSCVNAVSLRSIDFSPDNLTSTINMLFVLALITYKDYNCCDLNLDDMFQPVTKDHTFMIRSEIEIITEELEKKLKEVEEEKEIVAKEKRMVAVEKNEIAAKCKAFEIATYKEIVSRRDYFYNQLS